MKFKVGDYIKDKLSKYPHLIQEIDEVAQLYRLHRAIDGQHCWFAKDYVESRFELYSMASQNHTHSNPWMVADTVWNPETNQEEPKKSLYETIEEKWKQEGRCPKCGELGRYSMSVPVCSKHGEY